MRVFVGYGYNDRDKWIEDEVFPILAALGVVITHGKDKAIYGQPLDQAVEDRIRQSDALIAFLTLRQGQEQAEFNSHPWVRDELSFALGAKKPVAIVREASVNFPPGLIGNRAWIPLSPETRLSCVSELVQVVLGWRMRRILLAPRDEAVARVIARSRRKPGFVLRYRTRVEGVDSDYRAADKVDSDGFNLVAEVFGVPERALIEIEGVLDGSTVFFADWTPADARVHIEST